MRATPKSLFLCCQITFYLLVFFAAPTLAASPDITITIKKQKITVEVAANEREHEQGLMFRKHLITNHGMLFVFREPDYISMWMVNTYIPLSVAFIDSKGAIINIEDMSPLSADLHSAHAPAKFALEMRRGWFDRHGVKAGDKLHGLNKI